MQTWHRHAWAFTAQAQSPHTHLSQSQKVLFLLLKVPLALLDELFHRGGPLRRGNGGSHGGQGRLGQRLDLWGSLYVLGLLAQYY